jgi:RNA polymerase sigma-70 factor (ECF subfamily)
MVRSSEGTARVSYFHGIQRLREVSVNDHEPSLAVPADEELVERARAGDDSALDILVKHHHAAVYRVALSILGDEGSAQDVAQDAFIKGFRAIAGFRGEASFRAWILTIAANEARGVIRRIGRRKETSIDMVGPMHSEAKGPDERAVIASEASRARMMMERLPEKQRLAIAFRVDEGMSFREVGEMIGSSESAARVNYFHGIRRLRDLME